MDYREEFCEIWSREVTRPGADKLLEWLGTTDFFRAPASTRFHGACESGLVMHSLNVYHALMDRYFEEGDSPESMAVCGLLHDIGRSAGVAAVRHIIDGYDYAAARGWDEVARICLTHSFPVKDIEADIGKKDISAAQYAFIRDFLNGLDYDDYDKLIILCAALAGASGVCNLDKRFIAAPRRYGIYPFSIDRWNKTYQYKEYFEALIGNSIYTLLPHIEDCIYR